MGTTVLGSSDNTLRVWDLTKNLHRETLVLLIVKMNSEYFGSDMIVVVMIEF